VLTESNEEYKEVIEMLDVEYDQVMLKSFTNAFKLQSNKIKFTFKNMVDDTFPGENVITCGDVYVDKKTGKEMPLETMLSH